jgi:hypothetical protein
MAGERTPGSWAAAYAEKYKSKFIEPCLQRGVDFQAMVVETYGSWDPAALTVLNEIGNQYALHQGLSPAAAADRLFEKLSVTLMRLNARMLLVRGSTDDEEDDGGVPADNELIDYPFPEAADPSDQNYEDTCESRF